MTSLSEVEAYDKMVDAVLKSSEDQLAALFRQLNFEDVPAAREEMKQVLGELVDTYGSALTQGSLDWYEELRPSFKKAYAPEAIVPAGQTERIDRLSRYVAGIGREDPAKAIRVVAGALGREIQTGPRRTILRAADLDPSAPRFARVPVGKTCAFCCMLASRGWVYRSKDLAGGAGHEFHDACNCRIVPDWEHKNLPGYHPDDMYQVYLSARRAAVKAGVKEPPGGIIASYMREGHPEMFTDGQGVARPASEFRSHKLGKLADSLDKEKDKGEQK